MKSDTEICKRLQQAKETEEKNHLRMEHYGGPLRLVHDGKTVGTLRVKPGEKVTLQAIGSVHNHNGNMP